MSPDRPDPRPALRTAADGSVHPASPRASTLAVEADAVRTAAKAGRRRKSEGKADRQGDERVTLDVTVPRSLRKALRRKAETHGWTAEEAAAHVLRAWVDG